MLETPTVEMPEVSEDKLTKFPSDEQFTLGPYKYVESGRQFILAITEPNIYGRTHFLKNTQEVWEGTAKEFRQTFEKV